MIPVDPTMDSTERTRQTYDQVAGMFVKRGTGGRMQEQFDQFAAQVPRGGLVLDVGCGPGWHCTELARRGYRVTGLDLSAGILGEARKAGVAALSMADMRRLPIADVSVDGLWVCASFLHMARTDSEATLAEFHRVLRPSGILFLANKGGNGEQWLSNLGDLPHLFVYWTDESLDHALRRAGFDLATGWTHPPPPERPDGDTWLSRFAVA